jgi:hypothetical protein
MSPTLSRAIILRTLAVHLAVWAALSLVAGLAMFGEYERRGVAVALSGQIRQVWLGTLFLQLLGLFLSFFWRRFPQWLDSGRSIVFGYAAMLLVLLPPELVYQALLAVAFSGKTLAVGAVLERLRTEPKGLWVQCALYETGVYILVGASALWRHSRWRHEAWQRAQAENLSLRLNLEQQRMAALRSQFEPHFMFNALNALSALVRYDDKKAALAAISRLSDLLRYALDAGQRDWSSVGEELEFLESYLALQKIRYGARLQVRVEGDDARARAWECPPLLLQPLVENALRHDLDCHDEASDVLIRFTPADDTLGVHICNPRRDANPPNPGLGLGLANTRERVTHAYDGRASFDCAVRDGRFCVALQLPAGTGA